MKIQDSLYGTIYLTHEEEQLIQLPEFQRLKGLSMFGALHILCLDLKTAPPTMFDHALGSLHHLQWLIKRLCKRKSHQRLFEPGMVKFLRVAQLVWHCLHLPYHFTFPGKASLHGRIWYFLTESEALSAFVAKLGYKDDLLKLFTANGSPNVTDGLGDLIFGSLGAPFFDTIWRGNAAFGVDPPSNIPELHFSSRGLGVHSGRTRVNQKDGSTRPRIYIDIIHLLEPHQALKETWYHPNKLAYELVISHMVSFMIQREGNFCELFMTKDLDLLPLVQGTLRDVHSFRRTFELLEENRNYTPTYVAPKQHVFHRGFMEETPYETVKDRFLLKELSRLPSEDLFIGYLYPAEECVRPWIPNQQTLSIGNGAVEAYGHIQELVIEEDQGIVPNSTHPVLVAALHPEADVDKFINKHSALLKVPNQILIYTKLADSSLNTFRIS